MKLSIALIVALVGFIGMMLHDILMGVCVFAFVTGYTFILAILADEQMHTIVTTYLKLLTGRKNTINSKNNTGIINQGDNNNNVHK